MSDDRQDSCQSPGCCGPAVDRREFLKLSSAAFASLPLATRRGIAGPFTAGDVVDHFVPADKKLDAAWVKSLFERGERAVYQGSDLDTIGMPVGGLCAGQMYLTGDGRLAHWDIFNTENFSGYGNQSYDLGRKPLLPVAQGFAMRVRDGDQSSVRSLDRAGFPAVRFTGEYPVGYVEYADPQCAVSVRLEAFAPFIPLDAPSSALPCTLMRFTLKNHAERPIDVTIAGWLANAVLNDSAPALGSSVSRTSRVLRGERVTWLAHEAASTHTAPGRPNRLFADFENGYGEWRATGDAFGKEPALGTLQKQSEVSGFIGKGLVNTYLGGDDRLQGKLTSPAFTIEHRYIRFLIGGGELAAKTCMNLIIDGAVARTAVGSNDERLHRHHWDVQDVIGKQAHLEIVDAESGPWGHVNVDQIEFAHQAIDPDAVGRLPDFGALALALLDDAEAVANLAAVPPLPGDLFSSLRRAGEDAVHTQGIEAGPPVGALGRSLRLAPGAEQAVTFAIAWHFPNRREGHAYATRFGSIAELVSYLAREHARLTAETLLWHDTYYDSSLPRWLLDRLHSTVSTLATSTCQWWGNGRFWAWEGVGCCHGTCGHVWNYAHAPARLFPALERSVREMQDFSPTAGFIAATGEIRFRGEGWGLWAGDSQPGYVLKAYREHQCSASSAFLERNWPAIKQALEFLIKEDGNADGLLEGKQHNTYDIDFYGPNTMVGSLYLAALRAGEEMAREMSDAAFAQRCREIFEAGRTNSVAKLFNGEYFIQIVDLKQHDDCQYASGCLADQLFGQSWAHHVGLGYVYTRESVLAALRSIWRYNWAPDIAAQNEKHPPERWFARPGEAGLFTCTWPQSAHMGAKSVRYRDEVWTGIEYQVASHMVWEGMLEEGLAICRGIHERYHPSKHNPWNEVECGDHYARGMASWGVFTALCGFSHHGPHARVGFAPRLRPEDFRAAFTCASGWGTFTQKRAPRSQVARIELRWGTLGVRTLTFELPAAARLGGVVVSRNGASVAAVAQQDDRVVTVDLPVLLTLERGQVLEVTLATA